MENLSEIQILQDEFSPEHLEEAARILFQAFSQKIIKIKLFPVNSEQAIRIFVRSLIPGQTLLAIFDGKPAGILGIEDDYGRFMEIKLSNLTNEFGIIGGFSRFVWIKLINLIEIRAPHTLRVEAIAVAEDARGKGVGKLLLESVVDRARADGYHAVVLEVVDTNPRARKLYESFGFKLVKTYRFGLFTKRAGFSATDCMRKDLD